MKQQKDTYTPTAIPQTVDNGTVPEAESSVNKTGLPSGTTVSWKTPPTVTTPGQTTGTAIVHYPDGSEEEVEVPITVKQQNINGNPEVQPEVPEYIGTIGTTGVDESGNLLEPPVVDISEYTGPIGTTGVDENGNLIAPPVIDNPEFNGGVNGDPEVQPELPEFNGGVNGEPEVQPELPKINGDVEGEQQGRGNKLQPTGKVEKSTKRLANTGESETNTRLAGLGLAALGSLLAVAKRRREDEE